MVGFKWRSERRSIEGNIPEWPGWSAFLKYYDAIDHAFYPEDSRLYFVTIFEIGCRESEAILLRPEQFVWNDEAIRVRGVPVLKKTKKIETGLTLPNGKPETIRVKKDFVRDVFIKFENNILAHTLVSFVEKCDTDYLLPSRNRFSREIIPNRHTSRGTVYNRITEIHPDLFPHKLRGYRASHLVHERGLSLQALIKWFEWEDTKTALHYTRTRDIAKAMGIKDVPL